MSEDAKNRIEELFREAAPILKKSGQTQVPAHVLAKLRAAKEAKFPIWKELTAKEMQPLLLSVLAQRQMDGFDIILSLEKAHVRLKGAGEAITYGILSDMVAAGHLEFDLEDRDGTMRKLYRITDAGNGILKKCEAPDLKSLAAAILSM